MGDIWVNETIEIEEEDGKMEAAGYHTNSYVGGLRMTGSSQAPHSAHTMTAILREGEV